MAKNIIGGMMFVGVVNVGILLLISPLTQAASISYGSNGNPTTSTSTTSKTTTNTTPNTPPNTNQESDLQKSLVLAATELQEEALLPDSAWVFDFKKPPSGVSSGQGGEIVVASVG